MTINDRDRHSSKKIVIEGYDEVGYNYRMTDIQAAIGIQQLKKVDWIVEERRKIAKKYIVALSDINCIQLPSEPEHSIYNYQSFSIYIDATSPVNRNELMQYLLEKGISSRRGIMTSHREQAYEYMEVSLPFSEDQSDNTIILPLYVTMASSDINYVIDNLRALLVEKTVKLSTS